MPINENNREIPVILNEKCKDNKTISLGKVRKLAGSTTGVTYTDLKSEIERLLEKL